MQPAPICDPAKTIAPVETTVPAPISAGGSASRFAVDLRPSVGCLPTTAFSSTRTSSPSTVPGYTVALGWTSAAIAQRGRQHLQGTYDLEPVVHLPPVPAVRDEGEEVA